MRGLSILIPAYNFYPAALIDELYLQASALNEVFEILCFDDGVGQLAEFKALESNYQGKVHYRINPENYERRGNRDALAKVAQYNRLLFLDQDAEVGPDYLKNWQEHIESNQVVCGGVAYKREGSDVKSLRYLYGVEAEQKRAAERNQIPYAHFTCFNLMIDKNLYLQMPIHHEIKGYGHEDTMMGRDLKYAFAEIKHIDNAAFHVVNDSSAEYLEKVKESVENLARLIAHGKIDEEVRIFASYSRYAAFRGWMAMIFKSFKDKMIDHLTGEKPKIWVLNMFKITYLAYLNPATMKERGKI